nr:MAG TPA: hypothetical protein [Bacteriophage sp.]
MEVAYIGRVILPVLLLCAHVILIMRFKYWTNNIGCCIIISVKGRRPEVI